MRFTKIQRHIYQIATKGTTSDWFYLNRTNDYTFKKGVYSGKTAEEVYNLYQEQDNISNYWDYLQFLYDNYDLKTKKAVYEIYKTLRNETTIDKLANTKDR